MRMASPLSLQLASAAVVLLVVQSAAAQLSGTTASSGTTTTVTGTGPTIMPTGDTFPTRLVGGVSLGESTRPQNQNPQGINYSDCVRDMMFQFTVALSGFTGTDNMQVWATNGSDCTADTARGISTTAATCWLVNDGLTAPLVTSASTYTFTIPVRSLVGPQNAIPTANTLVTGLGADACTHQPSFAEVPITVWFLPLQSNGYYDTSGTAYQYSIKTDLLGPPAPSNVTIGDGDTLFIVNWTPNVDADTAGYDVFIDPPLGGPVDAALSKVQHCPASSSGTSGTSSGASGAASGTSAALSGAPGSSAGSTVAPADDSGLLDSSDEGAADADIDAADATLGATGGAGSTTDASSASNVDACVSDYQAGSGGTSTSTCSSAVLQSAIVQDASVSVSVTDEAGTVTSTSSGAGGISTIPCDYLVGASCSSGQPAYTANGLSATSISASTYTIKGLTNATTYNVVVSAVDGSGNVGPPNSKIACATPAPIDDFFKNYRNAGGLAGGGFCSLEAVGLSASSYASGVGLGVAGFLFLGRRGRKRSAKRR